MAEIMVDKLKIQTLPSDTGISAVDLQDCLKNCAFCTNDAKYKCPQCNAPYCSLLCYKSTNHLNCSEKFYKKLVAEELRNVKQDSASKKKMEEILQGVNQNSEDSDLGCETDDADDDIAERLEGVDLDDPDVVWSKLTQTEQKEFLNLVESGKTSDFITPWQPWWEANRLVEELVNASDKETPAFMENCPAIVSCPLLASIMKSSPHPCVSFNILNILAAYVWVVRIFNGDHQDNCMDACEAILTLSPVLSSAANYESAQVAVTTPKMESQNYPWLRESEEFSTTVQNDVKKILEGPNSSFPAYFIMAALSDIHALFNSCKLTKKVKPRPKGAFTASFGNAAESIERKYLSKELIKKCIKKIEFFLSYLKENPKILCET